MNQDNTPTQSAFDSLLAWLDPDRDEAGRVYEQIRTRLIKFFECRGRHDAEELTDETLDRVAEKVRKIANDYVGEKALYFYGVARNVLREALRKPPPVDLPVLDENSEDAEAEQECLDRCMLELTLTNQNMMREYYRYEKRVRIEHRKALAKEMGLGQNALRIQAHRIRLTLRLCVQNCLEEWMKA